MFFRRSLLAGLATAIAIASATLAADDAAAGGGGCHSSSALSDGSATTVTMVKSCFGPTVTRVDAGATVTFINEDPGPHTVTGAAMAWGSTANMLQGDTLEATFADEGVYPYACILHPGMVGAIVVGDGVRAAGTRDVASSGVRLASNTGGGDESSSGVAAVADEQDGGANGAAIAISAGIIGAGALAALALATVAWRKHRPA